MIMFAEYRQIIHLFQKEKSIHIKFISKQNPSSIITFCKTTLVSLIIFQKKHAFGGGVWRYASSKYGLTAAGNTMVMM